SGDLEAESRGLSVSEPKRKALRCEQSCRVRPLARLGHAGNRTRWNARLPALPREFADRRGRESEGCTGTDAALGCAYHAWNLWPRDRRRTTGSSGQGGRVTSARLKILRPNAPKLRMNGE